MYRGAGGRRRHPDSGASHLRFDNEFDFELSNAKFDKEQIEKELKEKLTISKKPSSGGDDGGSDDGEYEDEPDTETEPACYDKSKSFFDNLSCDARNSGGNRPNRRDERRVNTETFGVSGSYGRGGSRYNGRGGYRGGYRSGGFGGGGYYGGGGYGSGRGGWGFNNYHSRQRDGYWNNNSGGYRRRPARNDVGPSGDGVSRNNLTAPVNS